MELGVAPSAHHEQLRAARVRALSCPAPCNCAAAQDTRTHNTHQHTHPQRRAGVARKLRTQRVAHAFPCIAHHRTVSEAHALVRVRIQCKLRLRRLCVHVSPVSQILDLAICHRTQPCTHQRAVQQAQSTTKMNTYYNNLTHNHKLRRKRNSVCICGTMYVRS